MSSTSKTSSNSEYLQLSSTHSYDSNQSPLALLAQTCSSIGKDYPSSPSRLTSLLRKSSSSNSDKSFSSSETSSPSSLNNPHTNPKSTHSLKHKTISSSSSFIKPNLFSSTLPPLVDPRTTLAALLLRSSLTYLSFQQHSYSTICTLPGCFQCETMRQFLSTSTNHQVPSKTHGRFPSNEPFIEHIRHSDRAMRRSNTPRFHPYFKSSMMINRDDQLPLFYPHLSLSTLTERARHVNSNPDSKY